MYLGIDPSINSTGICVLNQNREIVELGNIIPPKEFRGEMMIKTYLMGCLKRLINEHGIKYCCIERPALMARSLSARDIMEIAALYKLVLYQNYVKTTEVSPNTNKKFITDHGHSKKDAIMKEVYKNFNVDTENHDQADAFGLATICYYKENRRKASNLSLARKEVISSLRTAFHLNSLETYYSNEDED